MADISSVKGHSAIYKYMAKNKTIDLQLSEVDLQALESIGVISVQNNIEAGSSNSNTNFRRAISWLVNRDCAMITAWRKEKKDGTPKTRAENNNDNKSLVQKLREYGYGVSKVQGCYAEVGHPLSRENSFLVFDLLNNSKLFFERLFNLSADFEQDSFLYKKAGETTPAYEIGTNEKFGMNKRKLAGVLRIGVEPKGAFSKIGSGTIAFE